MAQTRRTVISMMIGSTLGNAQLPDAQDQEPKRRNPFPDNDPDPKMPNGKSQKDAIATQEHAQALKEAGQLIDLAQQLKDELEKAGNFVVPVATVKKTEDIEKLARRIRGRLKD
jgi:hypothetical protein